jgi:predicted TIM-barrel fold metal-dependent hydrolase
VSALHISQLKKAARRERPLWMLALLGLLGSLVGCRATSPPAPAQKVSVPDLAVHTPFVRSDIPRIDVHTHILLGAALRAARMFDHYGIVLAMNLSGPPATVGLDDAIMDGEVAYKRVDVFTNLNWSYGKEPGYGARMAEDLVRAKSLGVRGVKIPKGLGLGFRGPDRKLLAVDDPNLDPVFEKAGELGLPIAMHIGDPQAFWQEPGPSNERYEELQAHPEWSFWAANQRGEIPSWQALFDAFVRRVARHPKTTIIGVHFGNDPEDPDRVAELLDTYPNLMIDTAARLPAIGRRDAKHNADKLRAFFIKYQDRILFGTDTGVGRNPEDLMFGSSGREPPTVADADRFYESTWRYFETSDTDIPSPTPIQGRWTLEGISLPRPVLEKLYHKNAERLLGITLSPAPIPKQETAVHPGRLEDL